MIKSIILVLSIFFITSLTYADRVKPTIPVEIDNVQTKRIAESLIRIIEYNTELKQSLVIERIQTPELKAVQKLEISQVTVGNKLLDFKTAAGVYIEEMNIDKGVITFLVDYIHGGKGGESIVIKCKVDANNNKLSAPVCSKNN